jgi:hypothetical protein
MTAATIAMGLGMAWVAPAGAETATKLPLCTSAKGTLAKNADLRDAVAVAFGKDVRYAAPDDADDPPACAVPFRLLHYKSADVLIMAHEGGGQVGPTKTAKLSAYVLRAIGAGFRLVTVKRNFGEGQDGWGNPGDITEAHFGDDDGMMISGGYAEQGETRSTTAFYAFRQGALALLGTIPTGFTNGGVVADDSKAVSVKSTIATGEPQPDRVRVTYTVKLGASIQTQETVWRSDNGTFALDSGTLPQAIAAHTDVSPSSPAVENSTDGGSAANDDRTKAHPMLTIEDRDLAPVPSAVTAAVKQDKSGSGSCRLIGKPISPSVSTTRRTYFVTTADACDWGAALGPIWIVVVGDGKATIVLSSGGYWVKMNGAVTNGFHNLDVGLETASERVINEYVYNSATYQKAR